MSSSNPNWAAVDAYVRQRFEREGDVYGWAPSNDAERPTAVLLVSEFAAEESFPTAIDEIGVLLRHTSQPERLTG